MLESCTPGSVRGAGGNPGPYRDRFRTVARDWGRQGNARDAPASGTVAGGRTPAGISEAGVEHIRQPLGVASDPRFHTKDLTLPGPRALQGLL